MATFSINDIRALMFAAELAGTTAVAKDVQDYWNDIADRLNELSKEMEEEQLKELMRRSITNDTD